MKTSLKNIALVAVMLAVVSCSSDDDGGHTAPQQTIAEIATANPDLSVLVDALTRADLAATLNQSGQFTVFAPTNEAFTAFLQSQGFANLNAVPVPVLKELLLNHVVSGEIKSSQLNTGYIKTLGKGSASASNTLSMFVNVSSNVILNGGVANGGATVITADVDASNGVVHVVNGVIGFPTVVNHAIANPEFSVLVQALTRNDQPDFAGILSGNANAPFTVFAPTNAAFTSLLSELSLSGLADIPQATLEKTLKYHVITNANVLSGALTEGMSVDTFAGDAFTISLSGGAKITDINNRVSNITLTDVQAANGVIHVLDKVLLPAL